jgi:hypothetical protein
MKSVLAAAALSLVALPASAALFTGNFTLSGSAFSDPGLVVQADPMSDSGSFNLEVGEEITFALFDIWTTETALNGDDFVDQSISASFVFTDPETDGVLDGTTDGKVTRCFVFLKCGYGEVNWSNPLLLSFGPGDSGKFSISLSNETFNPGIFGLTPGEKKGATVYATVSYDMAPVPLPAAGLVLLTALGGAAAAYRRRA